MIMYVAMIISYFSADNDNVTITGVYLNSYFGTRMKMINITKAFTALSTTLATTEDKNQNALIEQYII